MQQKHLSDNTRAAIQNALKIAVDQFKEDLKSMESQGVKQAAAQPGALVTESGRQRLVKQFQRQVEECNQISAALECSHEVILTYDRAELEQDYHEEDSEDNPLTFMDRL